MRVLALETSSDLGSVALIELPEAPASISPPADPLLGRASPVASAAARVSNAHGESLLPLVEGVLRAAKTELAAVDLLAVGIGPGSFTGTRIAVATAKGIAVASRKPLRGVDAFAALAIEHARREREIAVVAIDARKGEVYVSVVGLEGDEVSTIVAPTHLPPVAAAQLVAPYLSAGASTFGDGVPLLPLDRDAATSARRTLGRVVPSAFAVGALAGARHLRAPVDEVDLLEPLYVRPPDITLPRAKPGSWSPSSSSSSAASPMVGNVGGSRPGTPPDGSR
jgi:tRNA threonylcarbamoyladenosine biosynthesis protein TsaB